MRNPLQIHPAIVAALAFLALALLASDALPGGSNPGVETATAQAVAAEAPSPSPATGFDVHVTAPHVVDGVVMGPFHHYCKPISPEPIIQCILFETTDSDAPMTEVEYIVAKSITRNAMSRKEWNKAWHDHAVEIASGRVQIHDMADEDAAALAELVATTDGLIFHMWPSGSDIPTGEVSIAQAVSHTPLDGGQWEQQRARATAAAAASGGMTDE